MPEIKLNVCLVTNEFPALTETFITTKALELVKKGHAVTVIKNQDNNQVNQSHVALVKQAGIRVLRAPFIHTRAQFIQSVLRNPLHALKAFSPSAKTWIRRLQQQLENQLLSSQQFDVIHIEFSGLALSYMKLLQTTTTRTVVSCRGTAEKVKPLSDPARQQQLKELFEVVSAIHCVSEDMARTILPYCNHPQKIFVNRPSIDASVFQRTAPYRTGDGALQILTIGRFTFQKGYLIGLMAVKKLKEMGIRFTWTIVGDGPQKEEMLFHIHTLGLKEEVILAGKKNRDEILALYNATDVFLLPSVYEGIANVCLEAMSMEVPVVATRSGGMEEVIESGIDGMLCHVYDVDDMVQAVAHISNDAQRRLDMGKAARRRVLAAFTLTRQADEFEKKYQQLTTS